MKFIYKQSQISYIHQIQHFFLEIVTFSYEKYVKTMNKNGLTKSHIKNILENTEITFK